MDAIRKIYVRVCVCVNETLKLLTATHIDWFTATQSGGREINKP